MNKKFISFSLLALFAFSMFAGLVSATIGPNVKEIFQSGDSGSVANVLQWFFGKNVNTGLFELTLMFVLVLLVIYGTISPLNFFGNNKFINWGIAVIVSLLGVRFVPVETISSLATPSTALIAMIVAGVPLLIVFGLTKNENLQPHAKIIWWTYAGFCLFLAIYNLFKVTSTTGTTNLFGFDLSITSAVFLIFAIIGIIFALFWKYYLRAKRRVQNEATLSASTETARDSVQLQIDKLEELIASDTARGYQGRNVQRRDRIQALKSNRELIDTTN